jgi:hypothetical protein
VLEQVLFALKLKTEGTCIIVMVFSLGGATLIVFLILFVISWHPTAAKGI